MWQRGVGGRGIEEEVGVAGEMQQSRFYMSRAGAMSAF